ncbi:MAG: GNAT family N-acetyltransferase [Chloroflexi bacterium]|nr:GNAT family N-acetyltransferase [Chloroflexota bacterium]
MITHIEELSLNAWSSLQTMFVDGWVLRFADGYTKRANSINPMYASARDVNAQIEFCEQVYREKQLPVVFKMTTAVHPENLDAVLAERGYVVDSPTSVHTMELDNTTWTVNAELNPALSDEWLASFCRMSSVKDERQVTLRQILGNILPQKCFAAIRRDRQIIACGLGVRQGEYIGFYDIVTDAAWRKQGYGKLLMASLLAWGKANGARYAYLQVMLNNPPALRLYANLGFKEIYQYWYRIKA